ncbi:MAG: hypothetical protein ACW9W3_09865 [Candidatus Nitrosopumilus sp. bin_68KS]
MSLGSYTNFIEPTQIPSNIIWMLLGIPVNYILKRLWERHPIKFNRATIKKLFQMMNLFGRIFHFMGIMYFNSFMNKLHIKRFDKWCSKQGIADLFKGFLIFRKIEPEAADTMLRIIKRFEEQYRVNKITGLNTKPDLSDIEKEK